MRRASLVIGSGALLLIALLFLASNCSVQAGCFGNPPPYLAGTRYDCHAATTEHLREVLPQE